ncbi:hypothetical protein HJC23_004583 [Cyclotella cryptica]|uniref:Protein CASP n=1 Tax=Cyclotella cryptica TaxID=29204 RepID=A0ABD3QM61_9STRA
MLADVLLPRGGVMRGVCDDWFVRHNSNAMAATTSDLTPLQSALTAWQALNLPSLRPSLSSTATTLLESKERSLKARKILGESTKSLKRAVKTVEGDNSPQNVEALATECKATVKAYQEEIDSLTRRCKLAENSFVQLYTSIYECRDPASALVEALEIISARDGQVEHLLSGMEELNAELETLAAEKDQLKEELKEVKEKGGGGATNMAEGGALTLAEREELIRLRGEVAEYEVEFRGLKNQDITIRKLESKIAELEEKKEEEIQKELKKAQEELAESEGRRATEALEREAATARKLQSVELQLRAERAGREAAGTQLLKAEDGLGEREAAWEAQRQILIGDAERLREELADVCRERDGLRLKVELFESKSGGSPGIGSGPPSSGGVKFSEFMSERRAYEAEISELSLTCNALREELRVKEEAAANDRRALRTTIESLERDRSSLANQVSSLEIRVANAPSQDVVDQMRHELRILKRLEYNAVDLDQDRGDPEMTPGNDDDLESVLVSKLRKCEADLVRERREKAEGVKDREELRQQLAKVQQSYEDAEQLIASLENDLQLAVATPRSTPSISRASSEYGATKAPNPNTLLNILDPNAVPLPNPPDSNTNSSAASEKASDDHSVATIVMAQRDRLRARCDALEAERDSFKRELQVQVQTSESLKTDNTKLYEKVRYLQTFNSGSSQGGSAYMRGARNDRDLDLEALEQRYEASVDPFRQFSRAERLRKFNEMSPMERIVFIGSKTMLANKQMRTVLFFYILVLHLLVFGTTYHWSHSSNCDYLHNRADLAHFHGGVPLPETPNGVAVANAAAAAFENGSASRST